MARLTTLGVTFSYGIEETAGTKPTSFTQIEEASSIGGISLDTEQIDVSALEDYITKYAAGRQDTGGTWEIEFIMDPEKSVTQIQELYKKSKDAKSKGMATWFQVSFPDMLNAFFVTAECGSEIPMPEIAANEAATMSISLIISEYKGLMSKVALATA